MTASSSPRPLAAVSSPADWNVVGSAVAEAGGQAQWAVQLPQTLPSGDLLDVEIHAGTEKVWQAYTTAALQDWSGVASNLPAGPLTLTAGIFSSNWSQEFGWWNNLDSFTESALAPAVSADTVTGSVSVLSAGSASVDVNLSSPLPAGDLLDVEIHDGTQKVWQEYTTNSVNSWQATASGLPAGDLTLDVGIFSSNWQETLGWWNGVDQWQQGTQAVSVQAAATAAYQAWKAEYVLAAPVGLRVVRPQNDNDTVSEGMGYGMILAAANNDAATFQGLWNYTRTYLDANGLMNWEINADGSIAGSGSATDADEDIAYSLLLASVKWPGQGYRSAADGMMSAILAHDISAHNRVMPGDSWGPTNIMNPSYIAPAEYAAFAQATGDTRWQTIADQNVQWLQSVMNPQTGLVPDWLNANGSSPVIAWDADPDAWYYDAVRTPIRLYLAARAGNTQAAAILQTEFQWMSANVEAGHVDSGYTLAGTALNDYTSGPFLSAAAAIGAIDPQSAFGQASLTALIQWTPQTYYGASLRALTLAELSGSVSAPSF